jgi:hypothetical protein
MNSTNFSAVARICMGTNVILLTACTNVLAYLNDHKYSGKTETNKQKGEMQMQWVDRWQKQGRKKGHNSSNTFPQPNVMTSLYLTLLKLDRCLSASPLLFNFDSEKAITKGQETQERLKLNVTNQLLVYANDVKLLDKNIDTIGENMEAFWLLV